MTDKMKLQTYIREIMETLTRAGQIVTIPIVDDRPMSRYRAASLQVATRLGIDVTIRTIDGTLYARRTDFPMPPPSMPGLTPTITDVDRMIATLEAMTPWKDDPDYNRKVKALEASISALRETEYEPRRSTPPSFISNVTDGVETVMLDPGLKATYVAE